MSWYIDPKNASSSVSYTVGPNGEYQSLDATLTTTTASGASAATIELDPSVAYTSATVNVIDEKL